jgi:GntR family transcriptional regulator
MIRLRVVAPPVKIQTRLFDLRPFHPPMPSLPRYQEIRQELLSLLALGHWKVGATIDTESALAERFDVSIGTLRRAVDDLVADGLLLRRQGRGTFVNRHGRDRQLFYFFHVAPQDGPKQHPDVALLSFTRDRAKTEEARQLGLEDRALVIRIRNALSVRGRVAIIDDICISALRFKGLTEAAMRSRSSTVYDLYQERYGHSIARANERLRACSASKEIAQLLGVDTGTAVLQIRRLALGLHGDPIEWRVSHVQTRDFEYLNELVRK